MYHKPTNTNTSADHDKIVNQVQKIVKQAQTTPPKGGKK